MAIEEMAVEEEVSETPDTSGETTVIPSSLLGGNTVKPGDVVRLEVVSMDENGVTVRYSKPKEGQKAGSIDMMAEVFDGEEGKDY